MIPVVTHKMDDSLKPVLNRRLLFIGCILGITLVLTFLLGFLIGFAISMLLLIAVAFYIRTKQQKASRKFGFGNETLGGRRNSNRSIKLEYLCLSCGSKVSGRMCKTCGSCMKKPVF